MGCSSRHHSRMMTSEENFPGACGTDQAAPQRLPLRMPRFTKKRRAIDIGEKKDAKPKMPFLAALGEEDISIWSASDLTQPRDQIQMEQPRFESSWQKYPCRRGPLRLASSPEAHQSRRESASMSHKAAWRSSEQPCTFGVGTEFSWRRRRAPCLARACYLAS